MEMKKCKECGKLFMPKSMRSQYCDDLHYRPCPVCGKSVEAKYLSDPPRCCSKECQQVMRKQSKQLKPFNESFEPNQDISIDHNDGDFAVNILSDVNSHTIHPNLSPEGKFVLEDSEVRTYAGRTSCGFIQGHAYAIKVSKDMYYDNYLVSGFYDLTDDEQCSAASTYASKISLNQFFLPISKNIVVRR